MGILKTLQNKQVNNGIFIALLVIFAAGIAALWYGNRDKSASTDTNEHPLTQASTVSLCKLMPKFSVASSCEDGDQQTNVAGHSVWINADGVPVLRMDLISTLNLSGREPISSAAWLSGVLPEIKASGRLDWAEPKGPWSQAAITRKDNEQELLFEDRGIVLVMQSNILDRATLLTYADQASRTLRKASPAISSPDDATPKWTPAGPSKP
ncbi:MAG: hypothetical protein ACREPB_04450 [Arenimonas sp.]